MTLKERLLAIAALLDASSKAIDETRLAEETGFLSFPPEKIAEAILVLIDTLPRPATVLDLGCGNGSFALLAAAAGYDAYGIELDERLAAEAERLHRICVERKLIDPSVVCRFAAGNFFPSSEKDALLRFREAHHEHPESMPWFDTDDPYAALGISLDGIDALYCWSWPTQSRFLYNFLERATKRDAVFLLPAYERYTQGEHMNAMLREPNRLILSRIASVDGRTPLFIGRRAM